MKAGSPLTNYIKGCANWYCSCLSAIPCYHIHHSLSSCHSFKQRYQRCRILCYPVEMSRAISIAVVSLVLLAGEWGELWSLECPTKGGVWSVTWWPGGLREREQSTPARLARLLDNCLIGGETHITHISAGCLVKFYPKTWVDRIVLAFAGPVPAPGSLLSKQRLVGLLVCVQG